MIGIGELVPAYRLAAYRAGELTEVDLGQHRGGWTVLLFYPGDFTFVCPTELREATRLYPRLRELGADLFSVSTDSVWVHKAWADASATAAAIPFAMLSDAGGRLAQALGIFDETTGTALRGTYVVDPDGRIAAMEVHSEPIGRNMDELLRRVEAAAFVRENPGQVCPVSWQPGDATLTPGLALVGAI